MVKSKFNSSTTVVTFVGCPSITAWLTVKHDLPREVTKASKSKDHDEGARVEDYNGEQFIYLAK